MPIHILKRDVSMYVFGCMIKDKYSKELDVG